MTDYMRDFHKRTFFKKYNQFIWTFTDWNKKLSRQWYCSF